MSDDTAAINRAIASASAIGGAMCFPMGTFLTAGINLRPVNSGISFRGSAPSGQSGSQGTIIRLASAGAFLLQLAALRLRFRDLTFDGNHLPTAAVVLFRYLTSEVVFERVNIEGAAPGASDLVQFADTQEIDNIVFRSCRLQQNLVDSTQYARDVIRNTNPNAFNILFERCYLANGKYIVHLNQGSVDVVHSQVFGWTGAAFRIDTYAQQHVIDDVYTEGSNGLFYEQAFTAGGVTQRPAILRNLQINAAADITLIGTQPIYLENVVTAGNVTHNPVPDRAMTGAVSVDANSPVVRGTESHFTVEAGPGSYVRINGEVGRVVTTPDDHHLILDAPMRSTATEVPMARVYGVARTTAINTRFSAIAKGFAGTGYPMQVDEQHTTYQGTVNVTRSKAASDYYATLPDVARITVSVETGRDIRIPSLSQNMRLALSTYNAVAGSKILFSRVTANDSHSVDVGGLESISNVVGAVGWVEVEFDGSTWIVMKKGRN